MGEKRDKRKARLVLLFCVVAGAAGVMAAVGVAGNASAETAATTGHHGQDCSPGYHDLGNGTCVHNGGGGGNCGDNQGNGSGGNDNGFGHQGDVCDGTTTTPSSSSTSTSTSTPTTTTPTTTSRPTTTDPPSATTTATTTTGPFMPPASLCAARVVATKTRFLIGRRTSLMVTALGSKQQAIAGVTVLLRGAGLSLEGMTNGAGVAQFSVQARSAGVIRISLRQSSACPVASTLARVLAALTPPKPNYTG